MRLPIAVSRPRSWLTAAAAVAAFVMLAGAPLLAQEDDDDAGGAGKGVFGALHYRYIGPPGNRASAVVGVPGDTNVAYVGGASGGVWKTTDAGVHWRPVFDAEPAQSIGSLAIAPSDANVVWAGTGEPFIRSNVSLGNGIYKSTDAGKTWTHMGLDATGRIARIVIDPRNPEVVFAAAIGHAYGPQPERGVFRTRDGGKTWQRVLFVDENTGASDIAMDPSNPDILFAGTWQIEIKTWGRTSGGPGSGVYMSRDGGDTWKRLSKGLPEPPLGKIAVAIAPSNPLRVYALIETGARGSLWRSDDGGESFKLVNNSRLLNERPHYYTRMIVMPDDERELYFPSNGMSVSYDAGETSESIRWGGDNHDMWVDPKNPSRLMIGNDLGVMITTTRGREWSATRLPIAQIYHVATDTRVPYNVYGHMQDYASLKGPSNSLGWGIHPSEWTTTAGCETGWNIPDPVDPDVVWGGCYAGALERFDAKTGHARSVSVWPERSMGAPAAVLKQRFNWTFPVAISPHDHNRVYVGSQYVNETTDGGQTWHAISPDLTLNDKSRMGDSGGLTLDNLSVEYYGVVFAAGRDLGGHQRRPGAGDARRRRPLDERDGGHARPAAVRNGVERRALAPRAWRLLRGGGSAPGQQPRPLPLQDEGLREELDQDRERHPVEPAQLHARAARGPAAAGPAVRGHRERPLRLLRRRGPLAGPAAQSAARAGALDRHPGTLRRPGGRHLRTRHLDPRRPVGAARVEPGGRRRRHLPVRAAAGLPFPARLPARPGAVGCRDGA